MFGWGTVIAIEAQERVYYALCGNITINNCLNANEALPQTDEVYRLARVV